ncbi:VWA domain-containing protein [bacterium]|nr:VWA domain-containing protein [bacterium]
MMLTGEFRWAYPIAFFLLFLIPGIFLLVRYFNRKKRGIKFPAFSIVHQLTKDPHQYYRHIPIILRILVVLLMIVVLARPQSETRSVNREIKSLDIMLVLDLSESMRAYDIRPNRLSVAKKVLEQFISKRPDDRFGLIVFSGTPLTLSPLTMDHGSILSQLNAVHTNTIGVEGTAMGEALLMAVNRLLDYRASANTMDSLPGVCRVSPSMKRVKISPEAIISRQKYHGQPARRMPGEPVDFYRGPEVKRDQERTPAEPHRQVIILATDGVNNRGVQPALAAKIISEKKMKLYTIGLGGEKLVLRYERDFDGKRVPLYDVYGRAQYWDKPDELILEKLAVLGSGKYFHAHSKAAFERVMNAIDGLEKNIVSLKRNSVFSEMYFWVLCAALLLLVTEAVLRTTRFYSAMF